MGDKRKRIYISLPITGRDIAAQRETARKMAKMIRMAGCVPVSPFDNGLSEDAPREEHMAEDIRMLLGCDKILLCKKWDWSRGCWLERDIAAQCGIGILVAAKTTIADLNE